MFRSATFKLTMWYMAIVVAISLVFSTVIYHFASNALSLSLQHQTMRIYRAFPVFNNNPLLRSTQDINEGNHHILLRLIYFNALVLVASGFASYFLARRSLRPIEAAHERQKRFTADVSHELRTPLTSLKMTAEVALMDKAATPADLRRAMASTIEDANTMEQLINNLLRLTRLDVDQAQHAFGKTNTAKLVDLALSQVAHAAERKNITIVRESAELAEEGKQLDQTILADEDSLVQLLVILLDNAIKYSPDGESVSISVSATDDIVRFTIQDHGSGISEAALPHVFDRFYRADEARTANTETSGFGLGLSIAKLIADLHKGNITLSSEPGHGTTAVFELPKTPQQD